MILILSMEKDVHATLVRRDIRARGLACELVDASELGPDATLTLALGAGESHWETKDGRMIDLSAVTCVWFRRICFPQLHNHPLLRHRSFAVEEWKHFITGLFLQLDAAVVNRPAQQLMCPKPLQLRLAHNLGLRIPETLITNRPESVAGFAARHANGVVHKAFRALDRRSLATKLLDDDDRAALDSLYLAPVIFQECVDKRKDVRVTWIGGTGYAVAFDTGDDLEVDGRLNLDAHCEVISLPATLEEKIQRLMATLGLEMAALDFILDAEGEFVFLEVNPQGQYLFVELLSSLPLTRAVADLLVEASARRASLRRETTPAVVESCVPGGAAQGLRWR